jgi:disulfide bond formation protein DsbB
METKSSSVNEMLPYAAWFFAFSSVVGSLFFSEVMALPPCALCWWARIAMYPLVVVIGVGIIIRDARMKVYALALSLMGLAIAIYHNLLYYGFIPESITACADGLPCNAVQIELLGFITIPMMGLGAFAAITLCLLLYRPNFSSGEK